MDIRTRVGLRIRAIRKRRGLTQEDLADLVGRSVDAISNLERGISTAGYDSLDRLAAGLGVPLSEFFVDDDGGSALRADLLARVTDAARSLDDITLQKLAEIAEVLARR